MTPQKQLTSKYYIHSIEKRPPSLTLTAADNPEPQQELFCVSNCDPKYGRIILKNHKLRNSIQLEAIHICVMRDKQLD